MKETFQQYTARILGYLGSRDSVDVLRQTPGELTQLLERVGEAGLDFRPQPDKWSIRQHIAHMADVEIVLATRVRFATAEPGVALMPFDQDKWAITGKYEAAPLDQSLGAFIAVRRWNLGFFERLSPADREGFGIHQERGRESFTYMVKLLAGHDLNHLRQVRERLAASTAA